MAKLKPFRFITDAYRELTHVVWPTRPEVITKTIMIFVVIIVGGVIIGALDYALAQGIRAILSF